MDNKYVCVHGHFYQPPRENPWLNEVEAQPSAYPYHDWNHRITAECYARNAASRILDDADHIVDIVNNYARISFNFGPTLLNWLHLHAPHVYEAILKADRESQRRFGGHGSALAQTYNHIIMPLANARDQKTQVVWGLRDFEHRFGRKPLGMWCSETAVDTATLETLAAYGIAFTILSPYQAQSVRQVGEEAWHDVTGGRVDPRRPYRCHLPSGRHIDVFYYEGAVSQGIAFEGLLSDGGKFADRLMGIFDDDDTRQLAHIATDGETYGHHHRYGEMALTYALHTIEDDRPATLTIYSQYLEMFPPEYETQIVENSSWSCAHGVERWRSNCGCHTGGKLGGKQQWRGPLRAAFDWLRDAAGPVYEAQMRTLTPNHDPWDVRDAFVGVVLDRSRDNVRAFLDRYGRADLSDAERVQMLRLLEMQYHCLLMYTSCGWFFDEVTGIETMQDVAYAARALQLLEKLSGQAYEQAFVDRLAAAPSNARAYENAAQAYKKLVRPLVVDLDRVAAHFAVSSLFDASPARKQQIFSYVIDLQDYEYQEAGLYRLGVGRARMRSEFTWEEDEVTFAVLHLGGHQLFGGVRRFTTEAGYHQMVTEVLEAFEQVKVYEIMNLMDQHFGSHSYSFWHLFKDEQRRVLETVARQTLEDIESNFRQLYETNYPMITTMKGMDMDLPRALKIPAEFTVNNRLQRILEADVIDEDDLTNVIAEIGRLGIRLDQVTLDYIATERITGMLRKLSKVPGNMDVMKAAVDYLGVVERIPLEPDLWRAQNMAFRLYRNHYAARDRQRQQGLLVQKEWCDLFDRLSAALNVKLSAPARVSS